MFRVFHLLSLHAPGVHEKLDSVFFVLFLVSTTYSNVFMCIKYPILRSLYEDRYFVV